MDLETLVAEARERRPKPMPFRERAVALTAATLFAAGAAACALLLPSDRSAPALVLLALILLYALTLHARFEVGSGGACPTMLAFVPMLFVAPLPLVPLMVLAGDLLASLPDHVLRRSHTDRWLFAAGDNLWVFGPVVLLSVLAPGPPSPAHLPVYLAALAAMVAIGVVTYVAGDTLMYGTAPLPALRIALWAFGIGSILAPIAYMTAVVGARTPAALGTIVPLLWLLNVFSRERQERYAAALELNQTYRGTVMVLSDVVEADDNYTAFHCRSVVELAHAVGERMRLSLEALQELEIAALLHDVGKIAIPKEILNKPARLTESEFELMKTHTIEGQALLDRIGGRLARVGSIVRSCHERWDGRGYPDGLMGEEIPIPARIVFCCDAYSAMTTDRPYRRAMSREAAIEELRTNAGTQFEPRVVEALVKVVAESADADVHYSDAVRAVLATQANPFQLEASA